MRYRNFQDTPMNRRRGRSHVGGLDDASTHDDSTHEGLKAQHRETKREVADLKRNWQIPLEIAPEAGGGGYAATVTIAASDASEAAQERADLVCDGVADEEEINAALTICESLSSTGGRVLLSEGTFHTSSRIGGSEVPFAYTTLSGQGIGATRISSSFEFHAIISYSNGVRLCDFTLDANLAPEGGYGVYLGGQRSTVERVRMEYVGWESYGTLHIADDYGRVRGCQIISPTAQAMGGPAGGVYLTSAPFSVVTDCYFEDIGAMAVNIQADDCIVSNNLIYGSQSDTADTEAITVGGQSVVVGNYAQSWGGFPATIASGAGSQVANNVLV